MVPVMDKGNPYGSHRVIEPQGVLPQPASRVDNDMSRIWNNEILVDVETLNIDSASFTQIAEQASHDESQIKAIINRTVSERGKQHNPVTGSGGVFVGTVSQIGETLASRDLNVGDRIVSLVSLSLTPLRLDDILAIRKATDQVSVRGQAILFESGIYAKLPEDIPASLALAILDVAGAPAQTARLVREGDNVVIIGAAGKSGILCAYEAKKKVGPKGKVIGVEYSQAAIEHLNALGLCDDVVALDATDALACYETIRNLTNGDLADLVINCVNIPNTEMASALMCRNEGTIYFFSMATSFTKAALGAEGVGKDITMIIGNGYAKGHDEVALNILRDCAPIRKLYEQLYGENAQVSERQA